MSPPPPELFPSALGAVIRLPAGAFVPLMIICGAVVLLSLAVRGLAALRISNPQAARILGWVLGGLASAVAIFIASQIVPTHEANDRFHLGVELVSDFDAIIAAVAGGIAGVMWRYAGQRWLGAGVAAAVAAALIAKPYVWPLVWFETSEVSRPTDVHYFLPAGVVLAIVAMILALKPKQL